jgi:DMSO/TMAO reductase YedYZ molybdopterin-dependent catalytic subunit
MFQSLYRKTKGIQQGNMVSDPLRDWPATYSGGIQLVDYDTWTLQVGGHVAMPRTFTLAELKNFLLLTQNRRIVSAEGWTYRSEWEGFMLHQLVEKVKPEPTATILRQENLCGHVEYVPIAAITQGRSLFCFSESGKRLTPLYGGPLRLLFFDRYSYKGLGQLARLDFITPEEEEPGFWQKKGYPADGQIIPGKFYAFDLKRHRPVPSAGEVTIY